MIKKDQQLNELIFKQNSEGFWIPSKDILKLLQDYKITEKLIL